MVQVQTMKQATLIVLIPPERFRSFDGSVPKIGDIICLDQGFTLLVIICSSVIGQVVTDQLIFTKLLTICAA